MIRFSNLLLAATLATAAFPAFANGINEPVVLAPEIITPPSAN